MLAVPPRWTIEPNNVVSVERNRHVILHCQAEGVPKPTILWKKASGTIGWRENKNAFDNLPLSVSDVCFLIKGGKSGDYEEIREKMYTKVFSNGSLLFQNIKEDKEGMYVCQANNGIGNPIGRMVQLKVNCEWTTVIQVSSSASLKIFFNLFIFFFIFFLAPPYFSTPSKQVTVKRGDVAVLQCDVNGDKPLTVTWMKSGNVELTPQTNYRWITSRQRVSPQPNIISKISCIFQGFYKARFLTWRCDSRNTNSISWIRW